MIKIEDLSETRQEDFKATIKYNEPWMSDEKGLQHAIGALQNNTIEAWEQWGFGSFKTKKFVYSNGVRYYNEHKNEIDAYLLTKGVEIPEAPKPELTKKELEAQRKAQEKADALVKKMLYGAGSQGWTKEWYRKIKDAYKNNTLTITATLGKGEIELILASNLKEEELTDEERLVLMAYCQPQAIIRIPRPEGVR